MRVNSDEFQEIIWHQGREIFRAMPWRDDTSPYKVLVSELMLQQTQVDRVIPKFEAFMRAFPTINDLAAAPLADVLSLWSGLGYNRRAKFLHESARKITTELNGVFPNTVESLVTLPGVGKNTAGAIMAYSFNQPVIFIETNIRTVYFHHFFDDDITVTDAQLVELAMQTIDREHPREWYWALMDYGTYLKKQGVGRINKSAHYKKQAPLKGSLREVRGMIIKELVSGPVTVNDLRLRMPDDERFDIALEGLVADSLVVSGPESLHLPKE